MAGEMSQNRRGFQLIVEKMLKTLLILPIELLYAPL